MKFLAVLAVLAMAFAAFAFVADSDSSDADAIMTVDEFVTAVNEANARDDQTEEVIIELGEGVFDLPMATYVKGTEHDEGDLNFYLMISGDNITIKGAGIGETTITSSTYSMNGSCNTQNFVYIYGDNVKIQDLTIKNKIDVNKSILIAGEDTILENI